MEVVLASSSKQRQDILKMIGLNYKVIVSNIKEVSFETLPDKYVEDLSKQKGIAVRDTLKENAIIISADTIIYCDNKIYEKPKTDFEAFNNLKQLSGKKNSAYTGITIIDMYHNCILTKSSKVDIYFKNITDEEIRWYVLNENKIFNCCGYVPLGKASIFIDHVEGDYNTLLGLSPSVLFTMFNELGYTVRDFAFDNQEKRINLEEYKKMLVDVYIREIDNNPESWQERFSILESYYDDEYLKKIIDDTYYIIDKILKEESDYCYINLDSYEYENLINLGLHGGWFSDRIYIDEKNHFFSQNILHKVLEDVQIYLDTEKIEVNDGLIYSEDILYRLVFQNISDKVKQKRLYTK